jgi:GNAT superfamily N-acetyltransferase
MFDKEKIYFKLLGNEDLDQLMEYFNNLGNETKKRFGPHAFSQETIMQLRNDNAYRLFVAKSVDEGSIVGYTVIKMGWLDFEISRLKAYGLYPEATDFTIAPSIADSWQGKGLGTLFLSYIVDYAREKLASRRIILWGGVQSDNSKAVRLYQKTGFRVLGQFEHNGLNIDMILEI